MSLKITNNHAEAGQPSAEDKKQPFRTIYAATEFIEAAVQENKEFRFLLSEKLFLDNNAMTVISDIAEGNKFKCIKIMEQEGCKEFTYKRK